MVQQHHFYFYISRPAISNDFNVINLFLFCLFLKEMRRLSGFICSAKLDRIVNTKQALQHIISFSFSIVSNNQRSRLNIAEGGGGGRRGGRGPERKTSRGVMGIIYEDE